MVDVRLKKKWMDIMCQVYGIVDASVSSAIIAQNKTPVCSKGCFFCCYQKIPLTVLEALAIKEYLLTERTPRGMAHKAGEQQKSGPCPFLINGACSIYSVRPIACRRYIVFNNQCGRNEDPVKTRPDEVLKPSRKALAHALALTRPFYEKHGAWPIGENGVEPFFSTFCLEIRSVNWADYSNRPK